MGACRSVLCQCVCAEGDNRVCWRVLHLWESLLAPSPLLHSVDPLLTRLHIPAQHHCKCNRVTSRCNISLNCLKKVIVPTLTSSLGKSTILADCGTLRSTSTNARTSFDQCSSSSDDAMVPRWASLSISSTLLRYSI